MDALLHSKFFALPPTMRAPILLLTLAVTAFSSQSSNFPSAITPAPHIEARQQTSGCPGNLLVWSGSSTCVVTTTKTGTGDCNNFVGACVVYGTDDRSTAAPYTTTVYTNSASETSLVTSTITTSASTTATDGSECANFSGACVVYGSTGGGNTYATTTAAAGGGTGNGDGYIGADSTGGGSGEIGGAASLGMHWWLPVLLVFAAQGITAMFIQREVL